MAASMTYDMGNTDKLNVFRQELDRLGIPLCRRTSTPRAPDFGGRALDDGRPAIRYALAAIKNVGASAMEAWWRSARPTAASRDLADLVKPPGSAAAINKRQIENLACRRRAFDSLNGNRHQVHEAAETIDPPRRGGGQRAGFGPGQPVRRPEAGPEPVALPLVDTPDWPDMERLRHEFDAIGFYLSAHPLNAYGKALDRLKVVTATR